MADENVSQGIFDGLFKVDFDVTKLDKVAFRKWLVEGARLLEPPIVTPFNVDKFVFDNLDMLIGKIIDQLGVEKPLVVGAASPGEFLLVGEAPVSQGDVIAYLSQFPAASAEVQQMLKAKPYLVRRLQKFTKEEQELIVGNPFLLLALQVLLPILFKLLLNRFS